jgi:hypothetical protein
MQQMFIRRPTADAKFRLISESYTKTQTDAALALKANLSDVYTKTNTYTKSEVDSRIPVATDSELLHNFRRLTDKTVVLQAGIDSTYSKAGQRCQIQTNY